MSSKSFQAGRLLVAAAAILMVIAYSCNNSTKPPESKCPLFPQKIVPLDTTDPMIRIVSPNGGEVFHVGQQCTVKVCSKDAPDGGADIRFVIGGKTYTTPDYYPAPINVNTMRGDSAELALHGDSVVIANIFSIPDTLYPIDVGDTPISSVSNNCLIMLRAYNPPYYPDTTDCYFSIVK
jgi:hypothetical protein